jgi:CBS domain-containing protein
VTSLNETSGLDTAAIMHTRLSALPASVTVGEMRAYFAESDSRRLAVLVEDERFVGSIGAGDVPEEASDDDPAARYAAAGPTARPSDPADDARDLALAHPSKRLPVVDESGRLQGIVAIDTTLTRFCGT